MVSLLTVFICEWNGCFQVRKAIHVGNLEYDDVSEKVHDKLYADMPKTVRPWVEDLLNNDYKVL